MRPFVLVLLACAAGCNVNIFGDYSSGAICGPGGICPPRQQCVSGESICRTPCSGQEDCSNVETNGNSLQCDVDGECRYTCNGNNGGNGNNNGSGCPTAQACDTATGTCRQSCTTVGEQNSCPAGWTCVSGGQSTNVCRPPAIVMQTPPDLYTPPDLSFSFDQPDLAQCGAPAQPCCPFHSCQGGGCCSTFNDTEVCVPNGNQCLDGSSCANGACGNGTCGGVGLSCCSANQCTASFADCMAGTCVPCGTSGGPCCPIGVESGTCQKGSACIANGQSNASCL